MSPRTDLAARKRRGYVGYQVFAAFTVVSSPHSMATDPIGTLAFAIVGGIVVGFLVALWPTSLVEVIQAARRRPAAIWDLSPMGERYKARLRSTRPADRAGAEKAVAALCRDAGIEPLPCVWVRSPREAALARMALRAYATAATDPNHRPGHAWQAAGEACPPGIDPREWRAVVEPLEARLGSVRPVEGSWGVSLTSVLSDPPDPSIEGGDLFRQRVTGLIGRFAYLENIVERRRTVIASALADDGFAHVDIGDLSGIPRNVHHLATVEYLRIATMTSLGRRALAMTRLLEACGGWWATPIAVVLCERPVLARFNLAGALLHATDGPAIEYPDGWRAYAEEGVAMPRMAFERPEAITVEAIRAEEDQIRRRRLVAAFGDERYLDEICTSADLIADEPDVWRRRAAIERFGVTRFVQETGTVIDSDLDRQGQMRRLWRAFRTHDAWIVFVEVVNSTPEPDGHRHHYWLRVPPHMRNCQDAVAWTFGIEPAAYEPAFET